MKKTSIFLGLLIAFTTSHADNGTTQHVFTASARENSRASACQQSIRFAESSATNLPMLQMQGKVEKMDKKCDCEEETEESFATKKLNKYWSCLGKITFTAKK